MTDNLRPQLLRADLIGGWELRQADTTVTLHTTALWALPVSGTVNAFDGKIAIERRGR